MKSIFAVLLTSIMLFGCASNEVSMHRQGEVLANQITKADNTGTGQAIGKLSGLAGSDSSSRLSGWIIGGLIGDAIEEGTLSVTSELVIRLEDNRVINLKLPAVNDTIAQGDIVDVVFDGYGDPLDVRVIKKADTQAHTGAIAATGLTH
ncbi:MULTISPECIES: hypothetical protein [Shewanella]|uniref:hypothetical protein n=1 Tax=Shewanella TaxID=22 RepID=UPI00048E4FD1|nr:MULTISPECIES: hypothetical protein [Shewanella]QLE85296.1 hypothetical protein FLM48_09475 [Shewanella sp. Scap07]